MDNFCNNLKYNTKYQARLLLEKLTEKEKKFFDMVSSIILKNPKNFSEDSIMLSQKFINIKNMYLPKPGTWYFDSPINKKQIFSKLENAFQKYLQDYKSETGEDLTERKSFPEHFNSIIGLFEDTLKEKHINIDYKKFTNKIKDKYFPEYYQQDVDYYFEDQVLIVKNHVTDLTRIPIDPIEIIKIDCRRSNITHIPFFPKLINLNCSNCKNLEHIEIMDEIKTLNCSSCKKLKSLPFSVGGGRNLRLLNCSRCDSIKEIPDLDTNFLKELSCNYCYSLEKIGIIASIRKINCTYCINLKIISSSPRLNNIYAFGCPVLSVFPNVKIEFDKKSKRPEYKPEDTKYKPYDDTEYKYDYKPYDDPGYKYDYNFYQPNYYEELKFFGLTESASLEDIKKRYKMLALKYHPDKGGDPEDFKKLLNYYEKLQQKTFKK